MVLGVGIDLVERERVLRLMEHYGERFLSRILTATERAALHGDAGSFVAARIAGKEAAFKALGTGWAQGVTWRQIEIPRAASGAPGIRMFGAARERMAAAGATRAWISLTHSRSHAAAVVVLEGAGDASGSGEPGRREGA